MLSGHYLTIAKASLLTIELALASLVLGLVLAVLFALGEMSRLKAMAWLTTGFVTIVRGLPELLVIMFAIYGPVPVWYYITGEYVEMNAFLSGMIALSLIFASYASQTLRGALKAVPKGQAEAAKALGLHKSRVFFRIVFPQAVRHALPGLMNQWLVLLKDTALVSLIGVTDLLGQAKLISSTTHQNFTWYAIAAAIYLIITLITQQVIKRLEKRFELKDATRLTSSEAK